MMMMTERTISLVHERLYWRHTVTYYDKIEQRFSITKKRRARDRRRGGAGGSRPFRMRNAKRRENHGSAHGADSIACCRPAPHRHAGHRPGASRRVKPEGGGKTYSERPGRNHAG